MHGPSNTKQLEVYWLERKERIQLRFKNCLQRRQLYYFGPLILLCLVL
jgi:hypothetical protein